MLSVNTVYKPINASSFKAKQPLVFSFKDEERLTTQQLDDRIIEAMYQLTTDMNNKLKKSGKRVCIAMLSTVKKNPETNQNNVIITDVCLLSGKEEAHYKKLCDEKASDKVRQDFMRTETADGTINLTVDTDVPYSDQVRLISNPEVKLQQKYHS